MAHDGSERGRECSVQACPAARGAFASSVAMRSVEEAGHVVDSSSSERGAGLSPAPRPTKRGAVVGVKGMKRLGWCC